MKGSMFGVFEAFVCETFGADVYERVLDETTLETRDPFIGPGTYPPGDLLALVATTSHLVGVEPAAAVQAFGRFAFAHLARSVPHAMAATEHPRDFLDHLELLIHTEVRKVDSEAHPPRIELQHLDDRTTLLRYVSPLRLLPLVSGLLDGVGDWFDEPFDHELLGTDGDVATFRLTFVERRADGTEGRLVDAEARVGDRS